MDDGISDRARRSTVIPQPGAESILAHIDQQSDGTRQHLLSDHLKKAGELAMTFAEAFDAADWGRLAGLWHDLGKYQPAFQDRLRGKQVAVEHSVIGALLAAEKGLADSLPLAFVIAAHHGGLPNLEIDHPGCTPLRNRLRTRRHLLDAVRPQLPPAWTKLDLPRPPIWLSGDDNNAVRRIEFFTRMLFSCLVDADFLDTEEFFSPGRRAIGQFDSVPALRQRLDDAIATIAAEDRNQAPIHGARQEVLKACRIAAANKQGFFSLTVPTGGGKTLSAMAFALTHAQRHKLSRAICVIPYTSIIEQNAAVYSRTLGKDNVIEHHSNLDPATESDRNQLASENWDSPVIITTTVQFFESLLANRTSRCRKLHNIARSVIILDEVQSLPADLLATILDVLQELVAHYCCTVVLATATPPALRRRPALPIGIDAINDIIVNSSHLSQRLRRVRIVWPEETQPIQWSELATKLQKHRQVLAVVNRRQDARELASLLGVEGTFHLSALMCPAHRLNVINNIKKSLAAGDVCSVVSTQLIEAGVDLDFPTVYRAMAGLDSIVQAAGRCNREGRSSVPGTVQVFLPPTLPPAGTLRIACQTTQSMLAEHGQHLDPLEPAVMEEYFRRLYHKLENDSRGVQAQRASLNFANTSDLFRVIEDGYSTPVVVPYEGGKQRIAFARREANRRTLRALQPFTVSIYDRDLQRMEKAGAIELLVEDNPVRVLSERFAHLYDVKFGLQVPDRLIPRSESNIV